MDNTHQIKTGIGLISVRFVEKNDVLVELDWPYPTHLRLRYRDASWTVLGRWTVARQVICNAWSQLAHSEKLKMKYEYKYGVFGGKLYRFTDKNWRLMMQEIEASKDNNPVPDLTKYRAWEIGAAPVNLENLGSAAAATVLMGGTADDADDADAAQDDIAETESLASQPSNVQEAVTA